MVQKLLQTYLTPIILAIIYFPLMIFITVFIACEGPISKQVSPGGVTLMNPVVGVTLMSGGVTSMNPECQGLKMCMVQITEERTDYCFFEKKKRAVAPIHKFLGWGQNFL